jgi:hypothetical protein
VRSAAPARLAVARRQLEAAATGEAGWPGGGQEDTGGNRRGLLTRPGCVPGCG